MKVLLLNGSPKANGNTAVALHEMVDIFNKEGIETEVIHVGNKDIRGCVACGQCSKLGHCVFNDLVNEVALNFPPRSTNLTNSLRSPACPSRPVSIGTAFTASHQVRRKRIWRVCKPCAPWQEIWLFWWRALRSVRKNSACRKRNSASEWTLFGKKYC